MTNAVPQPRPVTQPRAWVGPLMVLAGGTALGFAPIGLRLGLDELGPQAIAFWRYLFAVPMLLVLVLAVDRRLPSKPNIAVFLAALFFTLDMALWHWSLTMTSVSNATFIVNLGNVLVGLAAWAFLKERPGLNWALAAGLAILGAAALSLGGDHTHSGALRGDLFALAAAAAAIGSAAAGDGPIFSVRELSGFNLDDIPFRDAHPLPPPRLHHIYHQHPRAIQRLAPT
jgi:drug/metabolite transporter (DMT)-like permease